MNITGKLVEGFSALEEVMEFDQKYFPKPWSESNWRQLETSQHLLMKWMIADQLIGFALLGTIRGDDTSHLFKIVLSAEFRGRGMATSFWRQIVEILKFRGYEKVYLEVEVDNKQAIGFYEKMGFECLRKAKCYYSNGSDSLILLLTL